MNRRTFLAGGVAAGTGLSLAGCLDAVSRVTGSSNTVLGEPELYDEVKESREAGHIPFPIHEEELPEATVPDALSDSEVTTTEFIDDRHVLMTFIFTRCPTVCETMTSNLIQVQNQAIQEGYADELAFLPMTFDPEYDTTDVLTQYSEERGADVSGNGWHFLRPADEDHAREVVTDTFGVSYEYEEEIDEEDHDHELPDEEDVEDHDHDEKLYTHASHIILANKDGYIERNYNGSRLPNAAGLVQDVEEVVEGW